MRVYTIDTTLRSEGRDHHCEYFPEGYGQNYNQCVTSFSQYVKELRRHLTNSKVKLYTISSDGSSVHIDDERDLRNAVKNLPRRGELAVTAIKDENTDDGEAPDPIGPYPVNVGEVMQRFGVPCSCYYDCGDTLSRKRYFWRWDNDYCICRRCYYNLSRSDRRKWKAGNDGGLPWEGDAPEATLRQESGLPVREEVCHLQYILTRLGFMPLSHTGSLVGSYRRNTARAVERFRRHYHIYGGDMDEYNSRAADKMGSIVRRWRRAGADFI